MAQELSRSPNMAYPVTHALAIPRPTVHPDKDELYYRRTLSIEAAYLRECVVAAANNVQRRLEMFERKLTVSESDEKEIQALRNENKTLRDVLRAHEKGDGALVGVATDDRRATQGNSANSLIAELQNLKNEREHLQELAIMHSANLMAAETEIAELRQRIAELDGGHGARGHGRSYPRLAFSANRLNGSETRLSNSTIRLDSSVNHLPGGDRGGRKDAKEAHSLRRKLSKTFSRAVSKTVREKLAPFSNSTRVLGTK